MLTSAMNRDDKAGVKALEDSIHALAQPLTALLFRLELGASDTDPQAVRATLDDARNECQRALLALKQVRSAAHAIGTPGELS